jgi:hypothetical protein
MGVGAAGTWALLRTGQRQRLSSLRLLALAVALCLMLGGSAHAHPFQASPRARAVALLDTVPAPLVAPGTVVQESQAGVFEGPPDRASCGAGSRPETGLQGEVPLADRRSGRSAQGYTCNLEQVGRYSGEGAAWQLATYGDCAYFSTRLNPALKHRGVQVVDLSDPAHPAFQTSLTTPAMLDPWESLAVNPARGLLGAVYGGLGEGVGVFDVYDVKGDCRHPRLLASVPVNALGHEGQWAPDGRTYYATGIGPGTLTAIDVSNPAAPRMLTTSYVDTSIHGLEVSDDGTRLYLADIGGSIFTAQPGTTDQAPPLPDGMTILDVSAIQRRDRDPTVRMVSTLRWTDGATAQHVVPVTFGGRPGAIAVDERRYGGPRLIDIGDERAPRTIAKLRTDIQLPANAARAKESAGYGRTISPLTPFDSFGYNSHYCSVDRRADPTILACSTFESGLRVFDIRVPTHPRELAYLNPGGDRSVHPASQRTGGTSAYTTARPTIRADRGEIWFTDQDRGLIVARFAAGTWPFRAGAATGASRPLKLTRRCVGGGRLQVRVTGPVGGVTAVTFLLGRATIRRDTTAPFAFIVSRARLERTRATRLRAVVTRADGRRWVLTRRLPRCSTRP